LNPLVSFDESPRRRRLTQNSRIRAEIVARIVFFSSEVEKGSGASTARTFTKLSKVMVLQRMSTVTPSASILNRRRRRISARFLKNGC